MPRSSASPPPLKRLGQHFLIDLNIVRKIVATAGLSKPDTVLEIGPGRGILTRELCRHAGRVIAVELDTRLRPSLEELVPECPNLELRFEDALTFSYETLPAGTVVVANLPYYVSSPLLFKLFASRKRVTRMVLMLQTEVAQRLVAQPGNKDYGILSVLAAYHAEVAIAFQVSGSCFRPRPEIGSSVVTVRMRQGPAVTVHNEEDFVKTVRAAFAHRRKTLSNSLRDEGIPPETIRHALAQATLQPSRRAETLSLPEFAALANALENVKRIS
jgi:16S rRNA (adenine1518-N6/adenine1519-N6)-dimethyltransferase